MSSERPSRWQVAVAGLRSLLTAAVLVALYYTVPMDFEGSAASSALRLGLGLILFSGLMVWQARAIANDDTPGLRALEGLCLVLPLFLLLFASAYFLMSQSDAESFTEPLTRTDALYLTISVFSTVGFGDISGQSQTARLVVSGQMMLDLIILGAGVRIILTAVEKGRTRLGESTEPAEAAVERT